MMAATKEAVLASLGQVTFGLVCLIAVIALLLWPVGGILGLFLLMPMGPTPDASRGIGVLVIIASWPIMWWAIFIISRDQIGDVTWRRTAKIIGLLILVFCAVYSPTVLLH